jgi:D-sedoheptulose 7-phosphate isomerase
MSGFGRLFEEGVSRHLAAVGLLRGDPLAGLERLTEALHRTLTTGGKVLACGNGGSAADAQHFVAELVGRYLEERRALAAVCLNTDTSVLTCVSNDYDYERVFARQVEALGRPGDLFLGITTSGKSPNILRALETAGRLGLTTARIQECHGLMIHLMCEALDQRLREDGTHGRP